MPENSSTRTANEKRITIYAAQRGHDIGRSKVQRLALKWEKRQQLISNDELRRLFDHSDPTANTAIRNHMEQKNGPGALSPKNHTEAAQTKHLERV